MSHLGRYKDCGPSAASRAAHAAHDDVDAILSKRGISVSTHALAYEATRLIVSKLVELRNERVGLRKSIFIGPNSTRYLSRHESRETTDTRLSPHARAPRARATPNAVELVSGVGAEGVN